MEFKVKSTGFIKTSQKLTGEMFCGADIIGGTAQAKLVVYDGGSNTANVLFQGVNVNPIDNIELTYPVQGKGNLWLEITGASANVVVRYL